MSDLSEHRLYQYLSEPMRLLGLTVDEISIVAVSVGAGIFSGSFYWQVVGYLVGGFCFFGLKKLKKMGAGRDLKAFLYWYGLYPQPSGAFPLFCDRLLLS